ncbi:MAG: AAA family ATPase [Rhodanobacteraceae bacterium]
MKLKSVQIDGFKAIKNCEFEFTDATMLVGPNNAGKSSVLQAIHLASRTINQAYEANKQSTLSLSAAEYVPSNDYRELAHKDALILVRSVRGSIPHHERNQSVTRSP